MHLLKKLFTNTASKKPTWILLHLSTVTAPLRQNFFMVIMRMETDLSTPKCSQRQELNLKSWKQIPPSGSQRPGEESHTPRERPSFANHQINKKVSNFTADYSRPGNSKIGFTANSAGNPGGQSGSRELRGWGRARQGIKINTSLATRKIRFATVAANNWPATQQRGL